MATQLDAATPAQRAPRTDSARLYQEGIIAGTLGAAVIAFWFLIIDSLQGRPLYTPSVLGTALFQGPAAVESGTVSISLEMVVIFTWVHFLVFAFLGGIASLLLGKAEESPNLGFGIVLFFVVFEFGFTAVAMTFAEPVLRALAWPAVLVGNLLAAGTMGVYLWRRHPNLRIAP